MKIYLIRHAQAVHNITGNTALFDPDITDLGKQQCINKKEIYTDVNMVLSSTATRTLQTTSLLFDIPVYATDLLLEYNTGVNCNSRHCLNHQQSQYPNVDFTTYFVEALPKETTWADGEARAKKLVALLKEIKKDNIVLAIVSHANFIRNIMTLLSHYNSEDLENCGSYIVYI